MPGVAQNDKLLETTFGRAAVTIISFKRRAHPGAGRSEDVIFWGQFTHPLTIAWAGPKAIRSQPISERLWLVECSERRMPLPARSF
mmetsp:Transcript_53372/g.115363  ORF Transcript_53372/g.115363 Transcript_53372/m.115363 type:complete len:86 (+) Transcript_53372:356-613(+)